MYITFILIHRLQRYTFICNWQNAAEIVIHCRHKNKKGATFMLHLLIYHLFLALFQCPLVIFFGDGVGITSLISSLPRTIFPYISFTWDK